MNLDDLSALRDIDRQNLIEQINSLPDQIESAYRLGQEYPLPPAEGISRIAICGMGASIISAELLGGYAAPLLPIPLEILRDYDLPGWCRGPEAFVVVSSHSGNTEETLSAYAQALQRGCRVLVLTTGGKLAEKAQEAKSPAWIYPNAVLPRLASGFAFGLLHSLFVRMGLLPNPDAEVIDMQHAMRNLQTVLFAEVPVVYNPAKRLAGQMVGRWVSVYAADFLAPVAHFWKNQVNGMAKAAGIFEVLPEADHTTLAGLENPPDLLSKMIAVFIEAPENHPRNLRRLQLTRTLLTQQGINTDVLPARGSTRLARIWTSVLFASYCTYYLALAYGSDPGTSLLLNELKSEMSTI